MKYLVTGGAGFIGSHLSETLINRGDSVAVLDNFSTGNLKNINLLTNNSNFEVINGSILDEKLLDDQIRRADYIIHLAAAVGVLNIIDHALDSLVVNLRGTENVLKFAYKNSKGVLLASTSEIYGKNSLVPLSEESDRLLGSPLKSRWSYSEAKAIDESLAYFYHIEKALEVKIVRLFNTVGPKQVGTYGMVVPRFVEAALQNNPIVIYGTGEQTRCFCHVSDAVRGIISILDSEKSIGEVFNIGNDQEVSINELAAEITRITNSKSLIKKIPYSQAYSSGFEDMQRRVPDISKAKKILAWEPKLNLEKIILDVSSHMVRNAT